MGNALKLQSVKLKQIIYSLGNLHTDDIVKMKEILQKYGMDRVKVLQIEGQ